VVVDASASVAASVAVDVGVDVNIDVTVSVAMFVAADATASVASIALLPLPLPSLCPSPSICRGHGRVHRVDHTAAASVVQPKQQDPVKYHAIETPAALLQLDTADFHHRRALSMHSPAPALQRIGESSLSGCCVVLELLKSKWKNIPHW
jgi:hypothetical protein